MIGNGARKIRPATLSEVEDILKKRQGTRGEFGFEQQTSLEYAEKFSHLSLKDAQKMLNELEGLEIKPEAAAKIVDILPKNKNQLLLILAKDKLDLPEKKMKQVGEIIEKYTKKAKKIVPEKPSEKKE